MYSAAQRARSKIGPDAWSAFGGSEHERKALLKKADFLADKAMRGELALFIGTNSRLSVVALPACAVCLHLHSRSSDLLRVTSRVRTMPH